MSCHQKKIFKIDSEKGLSSAERYQWKLYKKYDKVIVDNAGIAKVSICGEK